MPQSEKAAQHARFVETARLLECDEDEARFKEKLGKIAKAKLDSSPATGGNSKRGS